ncbi:HAMP domain-containing sensor histidine kinase [Bacillaceae bacterium]
MSIRLRLTIWYSAVLAVSILLFGSLVFFFLTNNLSKNLDKTLEETSQEVIEAIRIVESFPLPLQNIVLPDVNAFSSPGIYVQIIDERGRVLSKSRNLGEQTLPLGKKTLRSIPQGKPVKETIEVATGHGERQKVRVYSVPLVVDHTFVGLLQVGSSLRNIETVLNEFRFILIVAAFVTVVAAGSTGWFMAGKSLQPIHRLIRETSAIQAGDDLGKRLSLKGPKDEIYVLAKTINSMLARLEEAYRKLSALYDAQKRFVADASHELRTPLTSIRGNVELLKKIGEKDPPLSQEILDDIVEELERVSRLIRDLLVLARADAGYVMEKDWVSLREILADVARSAQFLPRKAEFRMAEPSRHEDDFVYANADYLKQLLLILLENAFKYTPDGFVTLQVGKEEKPGEGKWLFIRVEDTGIGISAEEQGKIFDRFYRADRARSRTGTGLGLAMAKWIVEQHGGRIEVESEPGRGSAFTVYLPVASRERERA